MIKTNYDICENKCGEQESENYVAQLKIMIFIAQQLAEASISHLLLASVKEVCAGMINERPFRTSKLS